jgi:hypothetical protein
MKFMISFLMRVPDSLVLPLRVEAHGQWEVWALP